MLPNSKARIGLAWLLAGLLASAAGAQTPVVVGGFGGGGGSGTVTEVDTGACLTGGPITTTGTVSGTALINPQTGTTYTIQASDACKLVTNSNAAATVDTIPQATGSFGVGFSTTISNKGAGTVTLTPTTSLINGAATLSLTTNQSCSIWSDGTDYQVSNCTAIGGASSGVTSITGTAAQITASASTGAVTLSLPAAVQTTSLALNGATIGADSLGVTGTATISGNVSGAAFVPTVTTIPTFGLYLGSAGILAFANSGARAFSMSSLLQANSSSGPSIPSLAVNCTSSMISPNRGSLTSGLGAQASGNVCIGASGTEIERWTSTGPLLVTAPADTASTDASVCRDTTSGAIKIGTGTLGICLGTSTARAKEGILALGAGLEAVMALRPVSFNYRSGWGYPTAKTYYGFLAEDVAGVLPKLVGRGRDGQLQNADYVGMIPVMVKAIQQQQGEIAALRAERAASRKCWWIFCG